MPDQLTAQKLRGLVLSASELKRMNPEWSDAMVEDYLSLFDNMIKLANTIDVEIDQKLEEVSTDFQDGSITFVEGGFLAEDNAHLFWDLANSILKITGIIQSEGRVKGDVVVALAMSPYSISVTDETVFADTDTGAISATLPPGLDGDALRVINAGTSGNDATFIPDGLELLHGVNEPITLIDLEHLDLQYSITKGWY